MSRSRSKKPGFHLRLPIKFAIFRKTLQFVDPLCVPT